MGRNFFGNNLCKNISLHERLLKKLKYAIHQSLQNEDSVNAIENKNMIINNIKNSLHKELSQLIQNFIKMNTIEIVESMISISEQIIDKNSSTKVLVKEIVEFIFEMVEKGC